MVRLAAWIDPVENPQFRRVPTGHQAGTSGAADRRGGERVHQACTFTKEAIEIGGLDLAVSRDADGRRRLIVRVEDVDGVVSEIAEEPVETAR